MSMDQPGLEAESSASLLDRYLASRGPACRDPAAARAPRGDGTSAGREAVPSGEQPAAHARSARAAAAGAAPLRSTTRAAPAGPSSANSAFGPLRDTLDDLLASHAAAGPGGATSAPPAAAPTLAEDRAARPWPTRGVFRQMRLADEAAYRADADAAGPELRAFVAARDDGAPGEARLLASRAALDARLRDAAAALEARSYRRELMDDLRDARRRLFGAAGAESLDSYGAGGEEPPLLAPAPAPAAHGPGTSLESLRGSAAAAAPAAQGWRAAPRGPPPPSPQQAAREEYGRWDERLIRPATVPSPLQHLHGLLSGEPLGAEEAPRRSPARGAGGFAARWRSPEPRGAPWQPAQQQQQQRGPGAGSRTHASGARATAGPTAPPSFGGDGGGGGGGAAAGCRTGDAVSSSIDELRRYREHFTERQQRWEASQLEALQRRQRRRYELLQHGGARPRRATGSRAASPDGGWALPAPHGSSVHRRAPSPLPHSSAALPLPHWGPAAPLNRSSARQPRAWDAYDPAPSTSAAAAGAPFPLGSRLAQERWLQAQRWRIQQETHLQQLRLAATAALLKRPASACGRLGGAQRSGGGSGAAAGAATSPGAAGGASSGSENSSSGSEDEGGGAGPRPRGAARLMRVLRKYGGGGESAKGGRRQSDGAGSATTTTSGGSSESGDIGGGGASGPPCVHAYGSGRVSGGLRAGGRQRGISSDGQMYSP
ncbi:hypothetical protein Rsub_04115 [Raphidocelis subcapitata]|uniref:Uncharacterized protein n=1 Tax=Raphidocelis subcapitata TaxID=307507 RepID=A0A2V0P2R0_9CHLO|nr:hypothetical protein Rsub_04115 [Raphidocelis subcapitata]|eukprot:GBF91375.1 hypothetical protein Rsub_04115 [Raphidocelis subcapitata]